MILARLFHGLRQVYTLRRSNLKLTIISEEKARDLVKKYLPKVSLIVEDESNDERLSSYSSHKENVIFLVSEDLNEETLLHEIGHLVEAENPNSANYKFNTSPSYTRKSYMEMEMEAWEWAKKHFTRSWGRDQNLYMRACLDGYRAIRTQDLPC